MLEYGCMIHASAGSWWDRKDLCPLVLFYAHVHAIVSCPHLSVAVDIIIRYIFS